MCVTHPQSAYRTCAAVGVEWDRIWHMTPRDPITRASCLFGNWILL